MCASMMIDEIEIKKKADLWQHMKAADELARTSWGLQGQANS